MNQCKSRTIPLNWASWLFLLYEGSIALIALFFFTSNHKILLDSFLNLSFIPSSTLLFYSINFLLEGALIILFVLGSIMLFKDNSIAIPLILSQLSVNLLVIATRIFLPVVFLGTPINQTYILHYGTWLNVFICVMLLIHFGRKYRHRH